MVSKKQWLKNINNFCSEIEYVQNNKRSGDIKAFDNKDKIIRHSQFSCICHLKRIQKKYENELRKLQKDDIYFYFLISFN